MKTKTKIGKKPGRAPKAEKQVKTVKTAKAPKAVKTAKASKKRVTFTVRADAGKAVYLAGSFNAWNPAAKQMKDAKKNGVYSTIVLLAPGTYEYKFVVDGVWQADPECADFVQNDCGTLNSVITVK